MQIETSAAGDIGIAAISGEIDSKTVPQAQGELFSLIERHNRLIIEMSGVTFLSSAGLRILLLLYRHAAAKNGKVVLVGLSNEIKDTMSMTGFLNFFVITDTLDAGLQALTS